MAKEKLLEKNLREKVRALGGLALKLWAISFSGLPDRMILMPGGRVYFAEIKETGKKPTPVQLRVHKLLRKLGFEVWVIDTNEELNKFLNGIII
jgi:hypothetical protein